MKAVTHPELTFRNLLGSKCSRLLSVFLLIAAALLFLQGSSSMAEEQSKEVSYTITSNELPDRKFITYPSREVTITLNWKGSLPLKPGYYTCPVEIEPIQLAKNEIIRLVITAPNLQKESRDKYQYNQGCYVLKTNGDDCNFEIVDWFDSSGPLFGNNLRTSMHLHKSKFSGREFYKAMLDERTDFIVIAGSSASGASDCYFTVPFFHESTKLQLNIPLKITSSENNQDDNSQVNN
ncbi:MAG: hypothetical protein ACOYK6_06900 [Chthoniobacterales bacterium]